MSYLLDKVTARFIVGSTIKLDGGEPLLNPEKLALDFFTHALSSHQRLFIVPATHNILQRLARNPRYTVAIHHFLDGYPLKAGHPFICHSDLVRISSSQTRPDSDQVGMTNNLSRLK